MEKWLDSDTLHINTKTKKTPSTQEKKVNKVQSLES